MRKHKTLIDNQISSHQSIDFLVAIQRQDVQANGREANNGTKSVLLSFLPKCEYNVHSAIHVPQRKS